jgi:DHA3 family macrolide efflux protein-like MFS transporter
MCTTDWKYRTILFLISQNISLFGSLLVQYAIIWHITLETQSGSVMTISILCGFIPTFLVSPFAGVWADRFDRRRLIVLSDALIAVATLGMAIFFHLGQEELWQMFAVLAVRSFGTGIQTPAVHAILPQIVPSDKLMRVNGINSSTLSVVNIISPLAGGALLSMLPMEAIFLIDVGTATLAIFILVFLLKIPSHVEGVEMEKIDYLQDLKEGFAYIGSHRFIKILFTFCGLYFVMVAPAAFLSPLQVARSYGEDVWRLSAIEAAFSAGMVLGGLLVATWGGFHNRIRTMGTSLLVFGTFVFLIGFIPPFWLYLACMVLLGISMPLFNSPFTVLLQQRVDSRYMGRVFSVFGMLSSSVMPMAMLVFGPLSDSIPIEWLMLTTGVAIVAIGVGMLLDTRLLKEGLPDA